MGSYSKKAHQTLAEWQSNNLLWLVHEASIKYRPILRKLLSAEQLTDIKCVVE